MGKENTQRSIPSRETKLCRKWNNDRRHRVKNIESGLPGELHCLLETEGNVK